MHLFNLPAELLAHIIYMSMFERDVRRALRLKLVCKAFRATFNRILFPAGLLDLYASDGLFMDWHLEKYHGADKLWHDYLVFSCLNFPRPVFNYYLPNPFPRECPRRFGEIRDVANSLLRHFETQESERPCDFSFEAAIDKLCWLGLHGATKATHMTGRDSEGKLISPPPNPGQHLLSAGTYFGCRTLVRDLLDQGYNTFFSDLFPSPMYAAAWAGQTEILELLQEKLPEFEDPDPTRTFIRFRSKIGPGSLEGAAARDDLNMVKLALYPPSREISPPDVTGTNDDRGAGSEDLILGERPGSIMPGTKLGLYIAQGMRHARSPEIYDYLRSFLKPDPGPSANSSFLRQKAEAGDVVMVRHILELGADPSPLETNIRMLPLACAINKWHEDVIDVLLEYGADPNQRCKYGRGTLLTCAARAGSMSLLHKLFDAGTTIDMRKDGFTLWYAIRREHTAMAEMILQIGVNKEAGLRAKVKYALDKGLDSMAKLVARRLPDGEDAFHAPVRFSNALEG